VSASLWLARRELARRRARAALAALVVASAASLVTATEVIARARAHAIAAEVDALGAPIRIVPRGVRSEAIARYDLGRTPLPTDAEVRVRSALSGDLRSLDVRRVRTTEVEGAVTPVVAATAPAARAEPGTAVLGTVAAAARGDRASIEVGSEALRVAAILPATATIDDTAVYVSGETMDRLGAPPSPAELRVYLSPGANPRAASERLSAAFPDAQVLRVDRGEVADGELDGTLARHRLAVDLVTAAVAALCLVLAAHLDAAERRVELATLLAIGAPRSALAGALALRSVLLAAAGAAGGIVAGTALASVLRAGPVPPGAAARTAALVLSGAAGLGIAGALPTALASALRNPVPDLQDS
jgi:hypothetical protein